MITAHSAGEVCGKIRGADGMCIPGLGSVVGKGFPLQSYALSMGFRPSILRISGRGLNSRGTKKSGHTEIRNSPDFFET